MLTERRKLTILARWDSCTAEEKISVAAEFLITVREGSQSRDWWHYLEQNLPAHLPEHHEAPPRQGDTETGQRQ